MKMNFEDAVKVHEIKIIKTPDGDMFPIYRDWDVWHDGHVPKMAYATTIGPDSKKGIILHKERTAYITAISGHVVLYYSDGKNMLGNVTLYDCQSAFVVKIDPGIAISLRNFSKTDTATIINLPSPAWHPDNEDTYKFDCWDTFFDHVVRQDHDTCV